MNKVLKSLLIEVECFLFSCSLFRKPGTVYTIRD